MLNEKREGLSRRGLGVVLGWWPSGCRCAEGACCSIQCTRVCTPPFCLSHSGAVQLWWLAMALVQCNTKNQFRNTTSGPLGYPPPRVPML